jgi:hypothetical protein
MASARLSLVSNSSSVSIVGNTNNSNPPPSMQQQQQNSTGVSRVSFNLRMSAHTNVSDDLTDDELLRRSDSFVAVRRLEEGGGVGVGAGRADKQVSARTKRPISVNVVVDLVTREVEEINIAKGVIIEGTTYKTVVFLTVCINVQYSLKHISIIL